MTHTPLPLVSCVVLCRLLMLCRLLQYGRTSPRRSEFFHQGSGYDTWDYLKLHAGPMKTLAGQWPILKLIMAETNLSDNHVSGST